MKAEAVQMTAVVVKTVIHLNLRNMAVMEMSQVKMDKTKDITNGKKRNHRNKSKMAEKRNKLIQ